MAAPSALSRNLAKAIAKFEPATPFRKPISLSSTFGMVPDLTTAFAHFGKPVARPR